MLENGHILIADQGNNRAIEVTRGDQIVRTFTAGGTVNIVAFASRLENGDTLLTDAGNSRAVEVDANDNVVWQYITNTDTNSVAAPLPTRAVRLRNGDTLISDQFNNRVIRVSPAGIDRRQLRPAACGWRRDREQRRLRPPHHPERVVFALRCESGWGLHRIDAAV